MKPRLVIFDFDGTLADTTATILRTYRMTIEKYGADARTDAECQATIGLPLRDGFRQLYPDFTEEELDQCVSVYHNIFESNKKQLVPQLYPGVHETLDELKRRGVKMSVASSRSRKSLLELCDENDISRYFEIIIAAEDVKRAKPNPEPVLFTLKRMSEKAEDTIVVGDMPVDIAMGSGAGCETVGVTFGNSTRADLENAGTTHIINSFKDLIDD